MKNIEAKIKVYQSLQMTLVNVMRKPDEDKVLQSAAEQVLEELRLVILTMMNRLDNNARFITRAEAEAVLGTYKDGSLRFCYYDFPDTADSETIAGWYYMDNDDESIGPLESELACADALIKHLKAVGVTLKQYSAMA